MGKCFNFHIFALIFAFLKTFELLGKNESFAQILHGAKSEIVGALISEFHSNLSLW